MTALYSIGILGAVVAFAICLAIRNARKLGGADAREEGLEEAVDQARKGQAIDEEVGAMSDDDLYDELHDSGK